MQKEKYIELQKKALNYFIEGVGKYKNTDELLVYAETLCMLGSQMINGLQGEDYKNGFLEAAIQDKITITPFKETVN